MTYFQPTTCQLLERLGLTSESGSKWIERSGVKSIFDATQLSDWMTHADIELCRAFTTADILLNAENLEKLWPSEDYMTYLQASSLLIDVLKGKDIETLIINQAKKRLGGE